MYSDYLLKGRCYNIIEWINNNFDDIKDILQIASYISTSLGMIGLFWAIHKHREDTKFKKTDNSLDLIDKFLNNILPRINKFEEKYNNEYKSQKRTLFNNLNNYYQSQRNKYPNLSKAQIENIINDYLKSKSMKKELNKNTKIELGCVELFYDLNVEAIYINKKMVNKSLIYKVSSSAFIDFYEKNQDIFKIIEGDKMSFKILNKTHKRFKRKSRFQNIIKSIMKK